jgi:CheY-like chemotaxis protein
MSSSWTRVLADGEPSGYEVCRALRADPETSSIPLLLMVSNQVGIDDAAVKACGANAAITKPFDTNDLIEKVKAARAAPAVKPVAAAAAAVQPSVKPTPVPVAAQPAPVAAKPAPVAAKPAVQPAPARPAPVTPAPVAAKPAAARVTPASMPVTSPASKSAPTTSIKTPNGFIDMAKIPVVAPIPFTPAHAPSAGILKRLQEAGAIDGVDPKAVQALLSLSREVVEQVVWEVVPELADQIIRQERAH